MRIVELEAHTAQLARDVQDAREVAASAQYELARRRERDGAVADLVLRAVGKASLGVSRAVVLDDHLRPRVRVEAAAPLSPEQEDEIRTRAARYGFMVEVETVPPSDEGESGSARGS
jgi:hypothetical protein